MGCISYLETHPQNGLLDHVGSGTWRPLEASYASGADHMQDWRAQFESSSLPLILCNFVETMLTIFHKIPHTIPHNISHKISHNDIFLYFFSH